MAFALSKNENHEHLAQIGSIINNYASGQIHQWGVRINCERSNCKDKNGSYHEHHGKIIRLNTREEAELYAASRLPDHQDDVVHRVILIPGWDVTNASTDLPEVDLTEV